MLRTVLTGAATAALLTTGLVATSPAPAGAGAPAATYGHSARPSYQPYGRAVSTDHVLRRGCKYYKFSYRVHPPTDEWAAEIFVINPNGRRLLSYAIDAASDPGQDTRRWSTQICRRSTVYGKHTIKMKITWQDGRQVYDTFVKPSTFRFTRP